MPTTEESFIACIDAILDSLVTITKGAIPEAQVVPNFIFDPDKDNWAGMLRSPDDLDDENNPKIHTICIYPEGLDEDDDAETPTGCINPTLRFGFAFYIGNDIGNNASNSARQMMREVALVKYRIAKKQDLDMLSADDEEVRGSVDGHNGLRVPRFGLKQFGEFPINTGVGSLEVYMSSLNVRA